MYVTRAQVSERMIENKTHECSQEGEVQKEVEKLFLTHAWAHWVD